MAVENLFGVFDEKIEELMDFLEPFDLDGTREKSSHVSSSRALVLREHLQESEFDAIMIANLKRAALVELTTMEAVQEIDKCKDVVAYLRRSALN